MSSVTRILRSVSIAAMGAAITMAVVHGVCAQQAKNVPDRGKLFEQVVSLRTELDMLEVECAAARANLVVLVRGSSTFEMLKEAKYSLPCVNMAVELRSILGEFTVADDGLRAMVAEGMKGEEFDEKEETRRVTAFREMVHRRREQFLKMASVLNRKKLELTMLERRLKGHE